MAEVFRPIAVRPPRENRALFCCRCLLDLQLLTIHRFLRHHLTACTGRVLDVGAGEAPWRELLTEAEYVGVDVEVAGEFGMPRNAHLTYYDGNTLPFPDASFDHVLCTEVLEHVPEPKRFLAEMNRVLRTGGSLILTVPWSARVHHAPYDYTRFTRFGLTRLLQSVGFSPLSIEERGNDVAVIANKLLVLTGRLLLPRHWYHDFWSWPLALLLAPVTIAVLGTAHLAIRLRWESKDDPLGYGVIAVKMQPARGDA